MLHTSKWMNGWIWAGGGKRDLKKKDKRIEWKEAKGEKAEPYPYHRRPIGPCSRKKKGRAAEKTWWMCIITASRARPLACMHGHGQSGGDATPWPWCVRHRPALDRRPFRNGEKAQGQIEKQNDRARDFLARDHSLFGPGLDLIFWKSCGNFANQFLLIFVLMMLTSLISFIISCHVSVFTKFTTYLLSTKLLFATSLSLTYNGYNIYY